MSIEAAKPATVRPVGGLRSNIGSPGKANHSETKNIEQEFVLQALRSASLRVRLVNSELEEAGTALKNGHITPEMAAEWAEEACPGCFGFIPETLNAFRAIKQRRESEAA